MCALVSMHVTGKVFLYEYADAHVRMQCLLHLIKAIVHVRRMCRERLRAESQQSNVAHLLSEAQSSEHPFEIFASIVGFFHWMAQFLCAAFFF